MKFDYIVSKLNASRRNDHDYRCKCPAHAGTSDDSLSISPGDDGIALLYCHAGCTYDQIKSALGEPVTESKPVYNAGGNGRLVSRPKQEQKSEIVKVYEYTDEDGNILFEKVRMEPKSFRVRVPSANGYEWKIGDTRRVIYNLPAVIVSDVVFIVEGEKDADRLMSEGLTATCNFDGASKGTQKPKWLPEYNQFFKGKEVYILPDNDEPGYEHGKHIKAQLFDIAHSVKMVELPDLPPAGDVSDWLDSGNTVQDLITLVNQKESISHKWKIKTLETAFEELIPTEYIVAPLVPKRSLNIWFGAPGSMKSMILMDMCFSILSGLDFIPGSKTEMETKPASILWIDLDNGNDVLKERFSAMARAKGVGRATPHFHYVSMPDPWLFVADITSQMDLKMLISDLKADLVIVDNLGSVTGDIDENSAQMVRIMAPLRAMTDELNVTFIMIHHQRKGGANGSRAGDSLRGHSVIEASLDYAVLVTNDEKANVVSVSCTKARRFKFEDFKARYNFEHKMGTTDLETAWFSAPSIRTGQNKVYDAIMDVLKANEKMTQERLKDAVYDYLDQKTSKAKITSWIKEMTDILEVIDIEKGPHNANLMYLKNRENDMF